MHALTGCHTKMLLGRGCQERYNITAEEQRLAKEDAGEQGSVGLERTSRAGQVHVPSRQALTLCDEARQPAHGRFSPGVWQPHSNERCGAPVDEDGPAAPMRLSHVLGQRGARPGPSDCLEDPDRGESGCSGRQPLNDA